MHRPNMDSPAVHAHLETLQGIINRMALNSASCKTWCVTIVSAILVVMADKDKGNKAVVAIVPVLLFFLLDAYYLHLEKCFIGSYNKFLAHVHEGTATDKELFKITPPTGLGTMCNGIGNSIFSFAVWPFYTTLAALCVIAAVFLFAPTNDRVPAGKVATPHAASTVRPAATASKNN